MGEWTDPELDTIGNSDAILVSWRRLNGTWTEPLSLWVVRHGSGLYLRSPKGPLATWYRSLQRATEGRIHVGDIVRDVRYEFGRQDVNTLLDSAYHTKYGRYPARCVERVTSLRAHVTTVRLIPPSPRSGQMRSIGSHRTH